MHILRWLCLSLLLAALVLVPEPHAHADEDDLDDLFNGIDYVAEEIVVQLETTSDLAPVQTVFNLDLIDQFGTRPIYRLRITDGVEPPEKADMVLDDPRIVFAEPNYLGAAPESDRRRGGWAVGGDNATYVAQWAPDTIRLDEAHQTTRGSGTVVAVLDTGVDPDHPALADALLPGFDFVDFDADPREEGTRANIGYGHGTHVAGLIRLVAPEAQILPVRVLDPEGVGNLWVLLEGLQYAADPDGDPATNDGADVINLSLSTIRPTDLLDELLDELTCDNDDDDDDSGDDGTGADDEDEDEDADGPDLDSAPSNADDEDCVYFGGIVVVAGAGNTGDTTRQYPAAEAVDGLLAVGATTRNNTLANFSTRGAWVHISAPGAGILSTVPDDTYGTWSGTSMAAPLVAGTAALLRAQSPTLEAPAIVNQIITSATPICAPLNRLDAAAALGGRPADAIPCRVLLPIVLR